MSAAVYHVEQLRPGVAAFVLSGAPDGFRVNIMRATKQPEGRAATNYIAHVHNPDGSLFAAMIAEGFQLACDGAAVALIVAREQWIPDADLAALAIAAAMLHGERFEPETTPA